MFVNDYMGGRDKGDIREEGGEVNGSTCQEGRKEGSTLMLYIMLDNTNIQTNKTIQYNAVHKYNTNNVNKLPTREIKL